MILWAWKCTHWLSVTQGAFSKKREEIFLELLVTSELLNRPDTITFQQKNPLSGARRSHISNDIFANKKWQRNGPMLFMWAGYDMDLTNPSGRMNKTFQIVFSTQGYIDPWGYAINFSRLLAWYAKNIIGCEELSYTIFCLLIIQLPLTFLMHNWLIFHHKQSHQKGCSAQKQYLFSVRFIAARVKIQIKNCHAFPRHVTRFGHLSALLNAETASPPLLMGFSLKNESRWSPQIDFPSSFLRQKNCSLLSKYIKSLKRPMRIVVFPKNHPPMSQ